MGAPNDFDVVKQLYDIGVYNLTTHDGQAKYVDDAVMALHAHDPKWGHLRKFGGQTQIHGHAEDSALYNDGADGALQSVDFIANAGLPNAAPAWQPDTPRYSRSHWMHPQDHPPIEPQILIPSYAALGDDPFFRAQIGVPLQADMALAGQVLNDGSSVWFSRTTYSLLVAMIKAGGPVDPAPIVKVYRNQWRAILGLPPLP